MNLAKILDVENFCERKARYEKEFIEEQLNEIESRTQELIEGVSKIKYRIYKIKNELKSEISDE